MKTRLFTLFAACCILNANAQQTVGLFSRTHASEDGYVLFAPMFSHTTYLIDKCGKQIHTWQNAQNPGLSVYLLPDGSLLRPATAGNTIFNYAGAGGRIQIMDWNSSLQWDYTLSSATECQHHDVCRMPNGNILAVVWEMKSDAEAIAAGRDPGKVGTSLWPDKVVELKPTGYNTADVVWEWKTWDHLVQDYDSTQRNYGVVSDHPELININHYGGAATSPDWLHVNSVTYSPELDQIMISSYYFNELWVIDHGTNPKEVVGHTGGKYGKGGDLLYRWGNPEAYGRGTPADRVFYAQHDPVWIPHGFKDAGKIMVYNNGQDRPEGPFSSVEVIDPPIDGAGNYLLTSGNAYGPTSVFWEYKDRFNPLNFYSPIISGASRLQNGNTLICEGTKGNLFEVDTAGNKVWEYASPIGLSGPVNQGKMPQQPYVFRCTQYPASYSGFNGHTLTPGAPIELSPTAYTCFFTPAGIAQQGNNDAIFKATNPFTNSIVLSGNAGNKETQVTLINSMGMRCGQWKINAGTGNSAKLDIPQSLAPGIYLLRINSGNKQSTIKLLHS